jgi:hypothetical protein
MHSGEQWVGNLLEVVIQFGLSLLGVSSDATLQHVQQMIDTVDIRVLGMSLPFEFWIGVGVLISLLPNVKRTLLAVRIASTSSFLHLDISV